MIFKVNRSTRISAFFFLNAQNAICGCLEYSFDNWLCPSPTHNWQWAHGVHSVLWTQWLLQEWAGPITLVPWLSFAGIGESTSYRQDVIWRILNASLTAVGENKTNVRREADMRVEVSEASFKPRSICVWSQGFYFTAFHGEILYLVIFVNYRIFKYLGSRSFVWLKVLWYCIPSHLCANKPLNVVAIFEAVTNADSLCFKIHIKTHASF